VIDIDDVVREILLEVTDPFPEYLGNALFAVGMVASEIVLDATFSATELVLRVLGVD
jgi:hypothetical protein